MEGRGQFPMLRCRQVWTITGCERGGNAVVLLHERAPRNLGRMRSQHELDAKRTDSVMQPIGTDAGGDQPREALVTRRPLRRRAGIALVITTAADPVMLLGDVGEMQKLAERAGDRDRVLERHPPKLVGEQTEILVMAGSGALRQGPHALDRAEHPFAGVFLQRLAEQLAEQPHVLPQRLVRIRIHGSTISQGRSLQR